jgi:GMP synthase (glutamine-hydrolysing)
LNPPKKDIVLIVDFGSQYTQLIARRTRELGVFSQIVSCYENLGDYLPNSSCVILSGGPKSVYDKDAPKLKFSLKQITKPILAICYGAQLIAHSLGGFVEKSKVREYGSTTIKVVEKDLLFDGIPYLFKVWMSHSDQITKIPPYFKTTAKSNNGLIASFASSNKKIWCVQFHPEVYHTEYGKKIIENFLYKCAVAVKNWDIKHEYKYIVEWLQKILHGERVICAVSGGIDSLVATCLVSKATSNIYPLFVDTGLLRNGDAEKVRECLKALKLPFYKEEAGKLFLKNLKNVEDPEKKRKIIGKTFIEIFEKFAKQYKNIKFLVQGTLYPDVIESRSPFGGPSSKIKSHHNVGGMPKRVSLKIVEPLRWLFKDEVKILAKELGIAEEYINTQPFPGPGLAVRVAGEVTPEKLEILRKADTIVSEEVEKEGIQNCLWQYFPILLSNRAVGVMGDARTYQYPIVLRFVKSVDGMTADWFHPEDKFLRRLANRLVNEVEGINRVLFDITSKPPATIEWE